MTVKRKFSVIESCNTQRTIKVKFMNQLYSFEYDCQTTLSDLQHQIYDKLSIHPERQKICGIQKKDLTSKVMDWKVKKYLTLIGTTDEVIEKVKARTKPDPKLVDDFHIKDTSQMSDFEEFITRLQNMIQVKDAIRRICKENCKVVWVTKRNRDRPIIFFDLHRTLMYVKREKNHKQLYLRPYLYQFLAEIYPYYDIGIWSYLSLDTTMAILQKTDMLKRDDFKICCIFDNTWEFEIEYEYSPAKKGEIRKHNVKSLELICQRFPDEFNMRTTLMASEYAKDSVLNPYNYIRMNTFKIQKEDSDLEKYSPVYLMVLANFLKTANWFFNKSGDDTKSKCEHPFQKYYKIFCSRGYKLDYTPESTDLRKIPLLYWKEFSQLDMFIKIKQICT